MMTYQADVIKMIKAGYDESSVSIYTFMVDNPRDCDHHVSRLKTGGPFPTP